MAALALWVVLLVLPGFLVARLLRLPTHVALAVAAPVTYGLVGAATPVYGMLDWAWNPWTAGAELVVALGIAAAIGRWLVAPRLGAPGPARYSYSPLWTMLGVAFAAVLTSVVFLRGTGGLDAVNQYWDAVWHTNYTQWIARSGQASPLRAGLFMNTETHSPFFYPSAMHALGALVLTLSGAPATVAVNAGILVNIALVVPVGAAGITWAASRGNALAAMFAAGAASLFSTLPYDQTWRPAWPFALMVGLSGVVVALLVSGELIGHPGRVVVAAVAVTGVVSVHPSGVLCVGIPVACWLLVRLIIARTGLVRHVLTLAVVLVLSGVALAVQLRQVFADSGTLISTSPATPYSVGQAVRWLALFKVGFPTDSGQWVLTGLAVAGGVLAVLRRDMWWLLLAGLAFGVLGVQTLTGALPLLRPLASGFWNDYWRLGGMVAWVASVLAGIALAELVRLVTRLPRLNTATAGVTVGVLLFAVTGGGYLGRNLAHMRVGYTPGVVGPAQLAAMRELPRFVPAGQIVLNDPMDGSPWMYAVAGAHPMFVHYAVGTLTADQTLLLRSLNRLDTDHTVQSAVRRLGIHYVFVGDRAIYPWTSRSPGFLGLDRVADLRPVFADGGATVYRVDLSASADTTG